MVRKLGLLLLLAAFAVLASAPRLSAQSPTTKLKVAAAANLTDAFTVIAEQFQAETGITVKLTFGATGTLATEIRNGAPFDLFAAADVATIDALIKDDFILPDSKTLYATGKLIIWWLADSDIRITKLDDLLDPKITYIAMANPDVAPYGKATRQTLKAAGLWEPLQPKLVVAENVADTKQLVVDGEADVGFIPVSLVIPGTDFFFAISSQLHKPIDQALGILTSSKRQDAAEQFVTYLTSGAGRSILEDYWYSVPCACTDNTCKSLLNASQQ